MTHSLRVLLLPSPVSSGSIGTVVKALGIARSLRKRNVQVCFSIGGKLAHLIEKNGFSVLPSPLPQASPTIRPISNMIDVLTWTGLANENFIEAVVKAELRAIDEFKPDLIFAETRPSAAISAAVANVPLATVASWPMHPDFPGNYSDSEKDLEIYNRILKHYKLPAIRSATELLFLRSDIKISPSLPELEPDLQAVPGTQFVGYMLDTTFKAKDVPTWYFHWRRHPLIFIYLSVSAINPDIYLKTIPETFKDLPFDVLCACGFHYAIKDLQDVVENVRFVDYIPVQAIIKDASLIIFHGGQDTLLMTLLHGLPSITFPGQHFERQYNAKQMAKQGATKLLPVYAFRQQRLRNVVTEVFQGSYKQESQRLSLRLQQYGGTEQGIDILLSAL